MDPTIISITSGFDPRMAAVLGWVVVMVKVLVDWIKTAATLPKWAPPALAFGAAFCVIFLLMLALGVPISVQIGAQSVLAALIATVLAVGQTALQERTKPSPDSTPAVAMTDADIAALNDRLTADARRRLKAEQEASRANAADHMIAMIDQSERERSS